MTFLSSVAGSPLFSGAQSLNVFLSWLSDNHTTNRVFVLVDDHTEADCLPRFTSVMHNRYEIVLLRIPSGEIHKQIYTCIHLWQEMTAHRFTKSDLLINLGGGVVTDIGGFLAGTFKRGVRFVNIPTTLMGMIDAGIGGKNGVDLDAIKNTIGLIYFPVATVIYPDFIDTLSDREIMNGMAEMYKHAIIGDISLWEKLIHTELSNEAIKELVPAAMKVKIRVVEEDPFEKGLRLTLNFGHSIGHALESVFLGEKKDSLLHGEAVVAGMIMATYISSMKELLLQKTANDIIFQLHKVFGVHAFDKLIKTEMLSFIRHDKKNRDGKLFFCLLKDTGNPVWDVEVEEKLVSDAFDFYLRLR